MGFGDLLKLGGLGTEVYLANRKKELPKEPSLPDIALRMETPQSGTVALEEVSPPKRGVSDEATLKYQLQHLTTTLRQLETHLSEGCKIEDTPCDCCGKHATDLKIYAGEAVPIAARQGKSPAIFAKIIGWADRIERIGSPEAVASGQYDYLSESGTASRFRKEVQALLAECQTCQMKVPNGVMELAEKVKNGEMSLEEAKGRVREIVEKEA